MLRRLLAVVALGFLAGGSAPVKDPLAGLPAPVAAYAERFDSECHDGGLGHVVLSDNYIDKDYGFQDVNGDGQRDYFVYGCMFGCSGKPQAFTGISSPCPWGTLLLSRRNGYSEVFVPGMVRRAKLAPSLLVKLQRPRALRNFCEEPADYDPEYIYELKHKRFVLLGTCPRNGAADCLAGMGSKVELVPGQTLH